MVDSVADIFKWNCAACGHDCRKDGGQLDVSRPSDRNAVRFVPIARVRLNTILATFLLAWPGGCGDSVRLPSAQQLIEFENTGPCGPSGDIDRMIRADVSGISYHVVSGDVLELTMPAILRFVTAEEARGAAEAATTYSCRVNQKGDITLPIVGDIRVSGKSLSQIESDVVAAYYPDYITTYPTVFARVLEYRTEKVSISGAVQKPGVYLLRSDQMSLVALLMEAGGIIEEGAAVIRIVRRNQVVSMSYLASDMGDDEVIDNQAIGIVAQHTKPASDKATVSNAPQKEQIFVVPVERTNIPSADVVLCDGDTVIVERLQLPLFSVGGLVRSPGNFPYPPDAQYNLMQALAFAGGLDRATEPRYATIYRMKQDGTVVSAIFEVVNVADGAKLTEALNTKIKAGDIIAVEHTPRTRTKQFLDTAFRINLGTYWRLNDAWED